MLDFNILVCWSYENQIYDLFWMKNLINWGLAHQYFYWWKFLGRKTIFLMIYHQGKNYVNFAILYNFLNVKIYTIYIYTHTKFNNNSNIN